MLSEMFWVFQKKKNFYKEKSGTVEKIKSVKNISTEKSATKVFQVYTSIVYDSFFWNLALELVLVLHCFCGDA